MTDFKGALGEWHLEVSRPQGGLQEEAYALAVDLRYGPGAWGCKA